MPTVMNSGSRPPSQAPAARRCSISEAISSMPRLPPIAPAWPSMGCSESAAPASAVAAARAILRVPSSGSSNSNKAKRLSSHCPNCVCKATVGTACSVIVVPLAPAITALSVINHASPVIRAHAAQILVRRSNSARTRSAATVASAIAAGAITSRNTNVPNSESKAPMCVPRSRATQMSSVLTRYWPSQFSKAGLAASRAAVGRLAATTAAR